MSDHDRTEWLITARATLNGIPADLLTRGCRVARRDCDHPSKIVPAIMREAGPAWESRKRSRIDRREALDESKPDYVTPEQATAILREYGLR